jgi:hypothetical protein
VKNVDYQASNLELDKLGLSPDKDKLRTARPIDGDSDTDFTAAPESGGDEAYSSPNPGAANSKVQLNKDKRGITKDGSATPQARQGMAKNELLKPSPSKSMNSSRKKSSAAQKVATSSKIASKKNGVSENKINTSKRAASQKRVPQKESSVKKDNPSKTVPEKAPKAKQKLTKKPLLTKDSQLTTSAAPKSRNKSIPRPSSKQAETKTKKVPHTPKKPSKPDTARHVEKHTSPDTAL